MIVKELVARLGLDVDEAGFSVAERAIGALRGGLLGVGAAVAAVAVGLAGAVGFTAKAAGEIDDLAKRTGLSAAAIQELGYAAEQSGSSMESVLSALQFIARNAAHAADGSKEAQAAFAQLGISVKDASGKLKPAEGLLNEAADALMKMEDGSRKTALVMAVFGKSAGPDLLQFLKKGSAGIETFRQEARDLGGIMGDDLVSAGDDFGDNLGKISFAMRGLRNAIAGPTLKALADLTTRFVGWLKTSKAVDKFKRGCDFLFDSLKHVAWIVAGSLVPTLYAAATASATTAGWFAALAIGAVVSAVSAAAAWLAVAAPFIGLALIIEDLYYLFTGGESVIWDWGEAVSDFIDTFTKFDPSDSLFVREFKTLVALIFDITDPAKWQRFLGTVGEEFKPFIDGLVSGVQTFGEFFKWAMQPIVDFFQWLDKSLGAIGKSIGGGIQSFGGFVGSALGNTPEARAPVVLPGLGAGAASMGAAAAGSTAANQSTVNAPQFNAPISITAQPGQSPEDIAAAVRSELEQFQAEKNRVNWAAVNQ